LRKSAFYFTLSCEDGEQIELPRKFFKRDQKVQSAEDLLWILSTLHFWGSEYIPHEVLEFFLCNDSPSNAAVLSAIDSQCETVKILSSLNAVERSDWSLFQWSLRLGTLAVVEFMYARGISPEAQLNEDTTIVAAGSGNAAVLAFVHGQGAPINRNVVRKCIEVQSVDCLTFCIEHGEPLHLSYMVQAARPGNFPIMKYLFEKGCPWDTTVTQTAAQYSKLPCLKFAHENGCEWSDFAFIAAVQYDHHSVVEYLHTNGCPWNRGSYIRGVQRYFPTHFLPF